MDPHIVSRESLIENRRKLLEFAVRARSHVLYSFPPNWGGSPHQTLKNKEGMADRLAEIYFIWREVACCPQLTNSLPHVRTKLGSALDDFTLSLVRVHTFCMVDVVDVFLSVIVGLI